MSSKKIEKLPPLEHGLLSALKALDQQVAREMQRSPAQREAHGVQKWEPYNKRVEGVASTIMDSFADNEITLDSLLILSQATAKALQLIIEDLGQDGLGNLRAAYCVHALEFLQTTAYRGLQSLTDQKEVN